MASFTANIILIYLLLDFIVHLAVTGLLSLLAKRLVHALFPKAVLPKKAALIITIIVCSVALLLIAFHVLLAAGLQCPVSWDLNFHGSPVRIDRLYFGLYG